jgi:hypothetical protein
MIMEVFFGVVPRPQGCKTDQSIPGEGQVLTGQRNNVIIYKRGH